MLLYMDDDAIHGVLVALLRKAGHDVVIPADFGLAGADDPVHLTRAIRLGRAIVTYNYEDFEQLHFLIEAAGGHHPGILIVRRDGKKRDFKPPAIVTALAKFLAVGGQVPDRFTILNQYR